MWWRYNAAQYNTKLDTANGIQICVLLYIRYPLSHSNERSKLWVFFGEVFENIERFITGSHFTYNFIGTWAMSSLMPLLIDELLTHIYIHKETRPSLVQILVCRLLSWNWIIVNRVLGNKLYWNLNQRKQFYSWKRVWRYLRNVNRLSLPIWVDNNGNMLCNNTIWMNVEKQN